MSLITANETVKKLFDEMNNWESFVPVINEHFTYSTDQLEHVKKEFIRNKSESIQPSLLTKKNK